MTIASTERGPPMGRLFELVEAHRRQHEPYPPSYSRIAEQVGVARQTLLNWRTPTGLIERAHLEALAEVTGVPYIRVLDAFLEDIGYIPGRERPDSETEETGS